MIPIAPTHSASLLQGSDVEPTQINSLVALAAPHRLVAGRLGRHVDCSPFLSDPRVRHRCACHRLREQFAEAGRFLAWCELEPKLKAGEGTLILENQIPKGPHRHWWTADDLVASSPVPLPTGFGSPDVVEPSADFAQYSKDCCSRYVDLDSGTALLTEVLIQRDRRTGKRQLAEKYPAAKVVTLRYGLNDPILLLGDLEVQHANPARKDQPQP